MDRSADTAAPVRIQIHGRHTSYNVQKVLWLADELSLEYAHFEVGGRFGGNQTSQFLSMNPHGKVPVLRDGARVVWESNTILRYLADVYARDTWIATDPYARTLVDRWLDWSIGRLERAFVEVFWGYYRTPPQQHDTAAIANAVARTEACLETLNRQLENQSFVLGHQPGLADIAAGVYLYRLDAIDLPVVFPPDVAAWYQRLCTRRGYQRWVMSDFTELQGRSSY